jgi:hypothetical protein
LNCFAILYSSHCVDSWQVTAFYWYDKWIGAFGDD